MIVNIFSRIIKNRKIYVHIVINGNYIICIGTACGTDDYFIT